MDIAQVTHDNVIPTGWVSAGMASSILAWLFFRHLPAKDAQLTKLIGDKDAQIEKLITDKDANMTSIVANHAVQVAKIGSDCTAEQREMLTHFREALSELHARNAEMDRERRTDVRQALAQIGAASQAENAAIVKSIADLTIAVADLRRDLEQDRRPRLVNPGGGNLTPTQPNPSTP